MTAPAAPASLPGTMKLDAKSFLAGLALAVVGLLAMGQRGHPGTAPEPGRYQAIAAYDSRQGVYVIDTATGRVIRQPVPIGLDFEVALASMGR